MQQGADGARSDRAREGEGVRDLPAAIVTGGSRGIGRAIALRLAQAGHPVLIGCQRAVADARSLAAAIQEAGGRARVFVGDVAEEDSVRRMVLEAEAFLGPPLIVINNAGIALAKPLLDTSKAEWDRILAVNLSAPFLLARAALPYMLQAGWGRIINVASVWGVRGAANEVAYSASKAGLIGFTRALAQEVGTAGITVNAIAPGAVDTSMMEGFSSDELDALKSAIPLGRLGTPQEVASLVEFLVSDAAAYLTGQVLNISGGW